MSDPMTVDRLHAKGEQLSHEQVERLVTESVAGSSDAFTRLYQAYLPQIYYYCVKRLRDDDEAIEVVQDTFLAAFMKLETLKNPRAFHSWIFSIAGAYVAGRQRRTATSSVHEQSLDALTERVQAAVEMEGAGLAAEIPASEDTATSPETALDAREEHLTLISAIDALTDAQKEAILLRYFAGLSVSEIAAAVGSSQNATLKRLHDARNSLRKILGADEGDLTTALKEEEATHEGEVLNGPGARVTLGIAGALPLMVAGTGEGSLLAQHAPAFVQLANRISASAPHSIPAAPVLAEATGRVAVPVFARIAAGVAALMLVSGGGYAIYRHNTAGDTQATTTVPAKIAPERSRVADAATMSSSTTTTETAAAEPTTQPGSSQADVAQAATTPEPAPTPLPVQPARPQITVPTSTLSYATGTTPQTAAQLIAASGATAKAADGATLPVTLGALNNIDWTRAGTYLCYLHATDSAGTGAPTQVLSVTIK